MRTRVKICCIADPAEARLAIEHGADAIGLVGPMPSGPGVITLPQAAVIAETAPPPVSRFLLSSSETADALTDDVRRAGVDTLQVVRHVDPAVLEACRRALPGVRLVQVIHVEGDACLDLLAGYEAHCDAFLLDSGKPGASTEELGGTGRVHNWEISARIVSRTDRPVFLAGGLKAANVGEALRRVRPYGIDLCSSVRTGDRLDSAKLAAFMDAVRAAERTL